MPHWGLKGLREREIENSNGQVICFTSGPVRAIPHGTRVKNVVGDFPSAFLVPDILLWDPLLHFPELVLLCPSCDEKNTQETFNPICWKDRRKDYDQPRLPYGLRNNVLLVGRVYLCRNKQQIRSHDQGILCQLRADFHPPFILFHKIGVTRELFQFFTSYISAGMRISDSKFFGIKVYLTSMVYERCVSSLRRTEAQKHFQVFYKKDRRTEQNKDDLQVQV